MLTSSARGRLQGLPCVCDRLRVMGAHHYLVNHARPDGLTSPACRAVALAKAGARSSRPRFTSVECAGEELGLLGILGILGAAGAGTPFCEGTHAKDKSARDANVRNDAKTDAAIAAAGQGARSSLRGSRGEEPPGGARRSGDLRARKRARSGGVKGSAKPPKKSADTRCDGESGFVENSCQESQRRSRIG